MNSRKPERAELRERFYQSMAETLALLHASADDDSRQTMIKIADILASTMDLPLVWIGRRQPEQNEVEILATAGPEVDYVQSLRLSTDPAMPGGQGPVAIALREQRPMAVLIGAPEFRPWRDLARKHGFGACVAAASGTLDGGQLVLAAYSGAHAPALSEELLSWAQRLVDELARSWSHQILLERTSRMSRYRDAQRTIQRKLLEQPDPGAVYRTLAEALADIAGAAAVDVFAVDEDSDMLRRMALVGPIADIVRSLPPPPRYGTGTQMLAPSEAFVRATPVVRRHPGNKPRPESPWRPELLAHAGAVGCWPLFGAPLGNSDDARVSTGVFVVITVEPDAFDEELCRLLDEVADAAGLALRQHAQRAALLQEQDRQTWLARHDALTELPNRRALDQHLASALAAAQRGGRQLVVGMLDLDDLKPINDRHGHAAGDQILIEVSVRLQQALRAKDYVARLGGDEFVLVFEDLHDEADLDDLLERVGDSLQRPMIIEGETFVVKASLGTAMTSSEAPVTGEQLLRRADQAMYRIKASKRHRLRWWMNAMPNGAVEPDDDSDFVVEPYGKQAKMLLDACQPDWSSRLPTVTESFKAGLMLHDGIARLLQTLPAAETLLVYERVLRHLRALLDGGLDAGSHRRWAARSGLYHACCGLEEVWLLEAIDQLRDILASHLSGPGRARQALAVVLHRLGNERQWQMESIRAMQRRRVAVLARINALAWSADGYLVLIQGVVDILVSHEEITACSVGRPDSSGTLTYEAVAGEAFADYLRALANGEALPIQVNVGSELGRGPSGRAWRTGTIHRCEHYGSDPLMSGWRDIAARLNVVSNVAIPLCPSPFIPAAVLTLYSSYAGALESDDQQAFLEQIKTVLDLALARLSPPRVGAELLPFLVRERWCAQIGTEALEMHYQPLVALASGRVAELEALARLRDGADVLLSPARFLPALRADDLVVLFRHGLAQAIACRESLCRAGHMLDMSVNAPAAALQDPRYAEAAAAVIAQSGCPPRALLIEILESPMGTEHDALLGEPGMQSLRALGVRLVEDDLGAGYSSLIRLRQWPFDRIKIDQAIVAQARQDPLGTLRFIRQLIRIGHDLHLEVVVEGLESAGMIEAASILGADFGQGYGLARPMPAEALAAWLADYRQVGPGALPQTGLGVLAGELRWEEQFIALPADPAFWDRHAAMNCGPGEYLQDTPHHSALADSHEAMHVAAAAGPADPEYRREREAFLALLVENVRSEEGGEKSPP